MPNLASHLSHSAMASNPLANPLRLQFSTHSSLTTHTLLMYPGFRSRLMEQWESRVEVAKYLGTISSEGRLPQCMLPKCFDTESTESTLNIEVVEIEQVSPILLAKANCTRGLPCLRIRSPRNKLAICHVLRKLMDGMILFPKPHLTVPQHKTPVSPTRSGPVQPSRNRSRSRSRSSSSTSRAFCIPSWVGSSYYQVLLVHTPNVSRGHELTAIQRSTFVDCTHLCVRTPFHISGAPV